MVRISNCSTHHYCSYRKPSRSCRFFTRAGPTPPPAPAKRVVPRDAQALGIQSLITLSVVGGSPNYPSYIDKLRAHKGFDMTEKGFFKDFLKANDSEFAAKVEQEVKKDPHALGYETELFQNEIFVPNCHALQTYATHYFDKYQIHIGVVSSQQLRETINQLNNAIKRPTYLGIITSSAFDLPTGHVVPLLFYFPGNQMMSDIECLVLDGLKNDRFNFREEVIAAGLKESNIYKTRRDRQADNYSCHTEALIVLRNALLSLSYHKSSEGFRAVLLAGEVDGTDIFLFAS